MATKLFLRGTQNNGIGATYFDMVASAGSSTATAVVGTVGSSTEIQWTDTNGGSVVQWVSGRVPSGGFTLTSTDISVWVQESNGQANCGGRYRIFKRAANGTETELGGGPFNDGVEFGTSAAEMAWTGNVTDTAFAEDDRILLKLYITNVGTMGNARTCTLTYDGADGATGDSFLNLAETVSFKSESTSHSTSGALTAQLGSVAGSAAHIAKHGTSGALAGQGSTIAGSAARTLLHAATGILAGAGALVAGAASRVGAAVTHATSGALAGAGSALAGAATRFRAFAASGTLSGPGSLLDATASKSGGAVVHDVSGDLEGQGAISGTALLIEDTGWLVPSGTLRPGWNLFDSAVFDNMIFDCEDADFNPARVIRPLVRRQYSKFPFRR